MRTSLPILALILLVSCWGTEQSLPEKFVVQNISLGDKALSFVTNTKNDTVLKLNPDKYWVCFDDSVENFLVVAPKDRNGWWAIDFQENFLFQVYNTSPGEPSPDELQNDRIRLIDSKGKIGFANGQGKVVIPPQFEYATAFQNDFAIIGAYCLKVPWDKDHQETGYNHYDIRCSKYGYVDKQGNIIEFGKRSFEKLWEELKFHKDPYTSIKN